MLFHDLCTACRAIIALKLNLKLFRSKYYQAFDLGLDPVLDDDIEIEKVVRQLGSEINLMMINEYMDESLILLKVILLQF